MYAGGVRVFVEFGPKGTLTKFVNEILKGNDDVLAIAVNPTNKASAETQLRAAAVSLAVAGINLSKFDPWGVKNPFKKEKTVFSNLIFLVWSKKP